MLVVAADTPVTTPEASTEATVERLLLQAPPVVAEASVVVPPWQTESVPVIGAGTAFMVAMTVAIHPVGRV
jgi:hypothetical protein